MQTLALNQHFNGRVHDLVLALKTRHNTLNPSCQLPAEILFRNFLELSAEHEYYCDPKMKRLPWLSATHACSYWRAVALECRVLWSNISYAAFGGGADVVTTMLTRSRGAPYQ